MSAEAGAGRGGEPAPAWIAAGSRASATSASRCMRASSACRSRFSAARRSRSCATPQACLRVGARKSRYRDADRSLGRWARVAERRCRQRPAVDRLDPVEGLLETRLFAHPGADCGRVLRVVASDLLDDRRRLEAPPEEPNPEVQGAQSRQRVRRDHRPEPVCVAHHDGGADGKGLEGRPALGEDQVEPGQDLLGPGEHASRPRPRHLEREAERRAGRAQDRKSRGLARAVAEHEGPPGPGRERATRPESGEVDEVQQHCRRDRGRRRARRRAARGTPRRPRRSGGSAATPAGTPPTAASRGRTTPPGLPGTAASRSWSRDGGGRGSGPAARPVEPGRPRPGMVAARRSSATAPRRVLNATGRWPRRSRPTATSRTYSSEPALQSRVLLVIRTLTGSAPARRAPRAARPAAGGGPGSGRPRGSTPSATRRSPKRS